MKSIILIKLWFCRDACENVDAEVVILHGDLDAKAQDRAVRPGSRRKVILSTNLAESSVTMFSSCRKSMRRARSRPRSGLAPGAAAR